MRTGRRFAAATAADWGLDPLINDLELVVSELLTNALLHARDDRRGREAAPLRLSLERTADGLLCRVADPADTAPEPEPATHTAESGRGLRLVAAVATAWGWERDPAGGKVVGPGSPSTRAEPGRRRTDAEPGCNCRCCGCQCRRSDPCGCR